MYREMLMTPDTTNIFPSVKVSKNSLLISRDKNFSFFFSLESILNALGV